MFDMLKQLKEMKSKVEDFKKSIENAAFFGQDSNNVVKVKISRNKNLKELLRLVNLSGISLGLLGKINYLLNLL